MAKKKEKIDLDMDDSSSGKGMLVLVTMIIIAIWVGIFILLVKCDVGGFGSSVMTPLLKNVPVLNKILPNPDSLSDDESYKYDSIDDAVKRIKELELELEAAQSSKTENEETIANLTAQIEELSKYKEEQSSFELIKQKFYEEVVFSDSAPDIKEYKAYYESIDPENAEVLYKQVVEQIAYNEQVEEYARTYSSMKPKEAAAIFDTMTDDLQLVADILSNMDAQSRADILGKMDPEIAAKVTAIMEPDK